MIKERLICSISGCRPGPAAAMAFIKRPLTFVKCRLPLAVSLLMLGLLLGGTSAVYASAYPGTNGKLVFVRQVAAGRHVFSVNPDGTGERDLTPTGPEVNNEEPQVSPDGARIVFVTNRDFAPCCVGQEIYVMNIDGTGVAKLTFGQNPDRPTWSADGTQIAYVRGSQIWIMNADGTAPTQLTNDATSHDWPTWSPDGLSIAFVRRYQPGDTGSRVYVIKSDGTNLLPISGNSGFDIGGLSWSPDGSQVAFVTTRNGGGEVWLTASDGTGESPDALVKCCRGPAVDAPGGGNPAWSPDGLQLAFESNGLGSDPEYPKHSIFLIDLGGSGLTRLTHGNDSTVNWGPEAALPIVP